MDGLEWKKLYTWKLVFEAQPFPVSRVAVLQPIFDAVEDGSTGAGALFTTRQWRPLACCATVTAMLQISTRTSLSPSVPRRSTQRQVPAPPEVLDTVTLSPASPFDDLLAPTLSPAFRAPILAALAALPPAVPDALRQAGFRIQVVEARPGAPLPFQVEPYPVDRLRAAAPTIARHNPTIERKLEIDGARVVAERSDPYVTFEDLARQRGASSPDEVAEMADLARRVNPTLRGELPPGRTVYIPDYYYWRGQRVPSAAWLALTQEEQGIAGTTFDKGIPRTDAPQKLILMSGKAFTEAPALAAFYLHHEIGHAIVDVLSTRAPAFSQRLHVDMAARMSADRAAHTLLRPYSGSEPDEFIADAFAARFLSAPASTATTAEKQQQSLCGETLRARDPLAYDLAGAMVAHLVDQPSPIATVPARWR